MACQGSRVKHEFVRIVFGTDEDRVRVYIPAQDRGLTFGNKEQTVRAETEARAVHVACLPRCHKLELI
jgi:hypothetical protein